jgi:hypothetical protein
VAKFPGKRLFARSLLVLSIISAVSVLALGIVVSALFRDQQVQERRAEAQAAGESACRAIAAAAARASDLNSRLYLEYGLLPQLGVLMNRGLVPYTEYRLETFASSGGGIGANVFRFFSRALELDPLLARGAFHGALLDSYMTFGRGKGESRYVERDESEAYAAAASRAARLSLAPGERSAQRLVVGDGAAGELGSLCSAFVVVDEGAAVATMYVESDLGAIIAAAVPDAAASGIGFRAVEGSSSPLSLAEEERAASRAAGERVVLWRAGLAPFGGTLVVSRRVGALPFEALATLALSVVFISAVLVGCAFILRSFDRRLRDMLGGIEALRGGDLSARIGSDDRGDELSFIATSFDSMVVDLDRYVDRVYRADLEQKKAEMIAFQSQINPHFLYNTLEAIRMRALALGASDVAEMIYILSSLFRRTVKGGMLVTVGDELKHAGMYLDLFSIRYPGQLGYGIQAAAECRELPVPKFLIQPLVENFILHGFDASRDDNRVDIRVELAADSLRFEVTDNGSGMGNEDLARLRERLASSLGPDQDGPVGLRNVQERLRRSYGRSRSLAVSSREGGGLSVSFDIPVEKGDGIVPRALG